jgi:alkylation response protein AidB-like acyl-CoA dehydrogenase
MRMWSRMPEEERIASMVDQRWGDLLAEMDVHAAERDAGGVTVPARFLAAAGESGLLAFPLPREAGGGGAGLLTWCMVLEQIGYRCQDTGFPLIAGIRTTIAQALLESGRPDLIRDYVEPIARGTLGIALAYSENADAFSMRTTLCREATGGYRLSGDKDFTTGGLLADVFLTYARTESGDMAACLVHRDDPGVEVVPLSPVGTRTSGPAALRLRDVPLAAGRMVAAVDGLSHAQRVLNDRRLIVCCAPVGRARALVELSLARLETTIRLGQPLNKLPNVQAAVGRMYIAVEAARAMLYRGAAIGYTDPLFDPLVSAAKHSIVEQVRAVVEEALRVLGGYFYYGDPYFGICMRDFAGLVSVSGTQDLLEVTIGALATAHLSRTRVHERK